jgi:deoxyhypusine synthase
MVNISRILDTLDKDNEELDNVLIENKELNHNILEKIENVINKVDYYDYFEKIVEQVIAQLNSINLRLKPSTSDNTLENKALNLQEIKTSYTMESERDVHDRVVSGSDISDTDAAPHKVDEIEFF